MAALSGIYNVPVRGDVAYSAAPAMADDVIYQGSLLFYVEGSGISPVAGAGREFAGISRKYQSVSAGDRVEFMVAGECGFPSSIASLSDLGQECFADVSAASDNPADCLVGTAGDVAAADEPIGKVVDYDAYTWVRLGDHNISGVMAANSQ